MTFWQLLVLFTKDSSWLLSPALSENY